MGQWLVMRPQALKGTGLAWHCRACWNSGLSPGNSGYGLSKGSEGAIRCHVENGLERGEGGGGEAVVTGREVRWTRVSYVMAVVVERSQWMQHIFRRGLKDSGEGVAERMAKNCSRF